MNENQSIGPELAMNAFDDIPKAKSDAKDIVGLVKSSGRVTGYQLSDGNTVSKEHGVEMAKNGEIKGVGIAHRKDSEYLKSLPDGDEGNNLGNLPSVSQGRVDSDSFSRKNFINVPKTSKTSRGLWKNCTASITLLCPPQKCAAISIYSL